MLRDATRPPPDEAPGGFADASGLLSSTSPGVPNPLEKVEPIPPRLKPENADFLLVSPREPIPALVKPKPEKLVVLELPRPILGRSSISSSSSLGVFTDLGTEG